MAMQIVHRAVGARMAAAGQAEVFAVRLADDLRAGLQHACDHGRIDVRHVAFEQRRTVHHRHAGHHDAVLDGDSPAGERALRRPRDRRAHVPRVVRIVGGTRPLPGAGGAGQRQAVIRNLFERVVGAEHVAHHASVAFSIVAEPVTDAGGERRDFRGIRFGYGHRGVSRACGEEEGRPISGPDPRRHTRATPRGVWTGLRRT